MLKYSRRPNRMEVWIGLYWKMQHEYIYYITFIHLLYYFIYYYHSNGNGHKEDWKDNKD